MEYAAGEVPVHYAERGDGIPVLVLHGAGVDHREMVGALDPILGGLGGYRRVYPDLPGMGHTPAPETLSSADDVLDLLLAFVDGVIGDAEFVLPATLAASSGIDKLSIAVESQSSQRFRGRAVAQQSTRPRERRAVSMPTLPSRCRQRPSRANAAVAASRSRCSAWRRR